MAIDYLTYEKYSGRAGRGRGRTVGARGRPGAWASWAAWRGRVQERYCTDPAYSMFRVPDLMAVGFLVIMLFVWMVESTP